MKTDRKLLKERGIFYIVVGVFFGFIFLNTLIWLIPRINEPSQFVLLGETNLKIIGSVFYSANILLFLLSMADIKNNFKNKDFLGYGLLIGAVFWGALIILEFFPIWNRKLHLIELFFAFLFYVLLISSGIQIKRIYGYVRKKRK